MNLGNQPLGEVRVINAIYQLGNIRVINATPHPIRFKMPDGSVEVVESDPEVVKIFDAKAVEKGWQVSKLGDTPTISFVKKRFEGTAQGKDIAAQLALSTRENLILVLGSIVSAQVYGYPVVSPVPVPGTERAVPSDKIYLSNKFNLFDLTK